MKSNINHSLFYSIGIFLISSICIHNSYAANENDLTSSYVEDMITYDNSPTNQATSINFKSIDDIPKKVKLPDGNTITTKSVNYIVGKNGDYNFEYEGYDGGLQSKNIRLTNIDTTPPTINYSKHKETDADGKEMVILYVEGIDNESGMKHLLSWDGEKYWYEENGVIYAQDLKFIYSNGNFFYVAVDNAGNKSSINIKISELPEIEYNSPIDSIKYRLSGATKLSTWTEYNELFTIKNEGSTNIEAKATDRAGNTSDIITTNVQIDKTNPYATYSVIYDNKYTKAIVNIHANDMVSGVKHIVGIDGSIINDTSVSYEIYSNGTYLISTIDKANNIHISNIEVDKINGSFQSGIKSIEYQLSGATKTSWINYTTPFNITNEGVTTVQGRVTDNAGNITTSNLMTVQIDKTEPGIVSSIIYNANNTEATVDVTFTDSLSGIKEVIDVYGNKTSSTNHNFKVNKNGNYIVCATDNAGNINFYNITVDGLEGGEISSGIREIKYKLTGATTSTWTTYTGPIAISKEGTTTVLAKAYDNAGNVSSEVSLLVKIDKTKPVNNQLTIIPIN